LGPPSVAAAVLRRLDRLPAPAVALARAVAVLGTGTAVRHAAALIGVDVETATRDADALAAADILSTARPLDFVHPIVRRAVHDAIPTGERAVAHGKAARILLDEGAPAERVAPHLMATEPAGDPSVVKVLRAAATRSARRGAPDAAAAYLRRALAEPAAGALRADLLRELGRAEISAGQPDGVAHLQDALAATPPGPARAAVARELALGLVVPGRYLDAIAALEGAIAAIGDTDPDRALLLTAELTTVAHMDPATQPSADRYAAQIPHDLAGDTPAQRVALASLAMQRLVEGAPAAEVADLADRAVRGGLIAEQTADFHVVYDALGTLWTTDAVDLADLAFTQALADARARGSVLAFARASCFRSQFHYRLGRLPDAEADARASLDAASPGWRIVHVALSVLVDVLVERGEPDEAEAALRAAGAERDLPYTFMSDFLLFSRGRLRLAQGRVDEAVADLVEADRREAVWPGRSPAVFPIRSQLALARLALGDREQACRLADEEVRLARRLGTGYAVGVALRAAGLVAGGGDGIALLTEAVDVLDGSPARLEHARASTDLGAALRRAGRRAEATRHLSTGLDLASRCGAAALADRARAELVAAGARPRRVRTSGPPSLTASERRVAGMAASGMSNREIAQALFVTLRTVELHLTHAYQKLGISSREQLGTALAG
jgi:DNA-binding CsgD family transcriptional regulator